MSLAPLGGAQAGPQAEARETMGAAALAAVPLQGGGPGGGGPVGGGPQEGASLGTTKS